MRRETTSSVLFVTASTRMSDHVCQGLFFWHKSQEIVSPSESDGAILMYDDVTPAWDGFVWTWVYAGKKYQRLLFKTVCCVVYLFQLVTVVFPSQARTAQLWLLQYYNRGKANASQFGARQSDEKRRKPEHAIQYFFSPMNFSLFQPIS